jgi:hypothetical protein
VAQQRQDRRQFFVAFEAFEKSSQYRRSEE